MRAAQTAPAPRRRAAAAGAPKRRAAAAGDAAAAPAYKRARTTQQDGAVPPPVPSPGDESDSSGPDIPALSMIAMPSSAPAPPLSAVAPSPTAASPASGPAAPAAAPKAAAPAAGEQPQVGRPPVHEVFRGGARLAWPVRCLVYRGHSDGVWATRFSPDARLIGSSSDDHTAHLFDSRSGALVGVLRGHVDEVHALAFSPDGRWVATGSHDHTARLWEVETAGQVLVIEHHSLEVTDVHMSDDRLLTASWDETACVWGLRMPPVGSARRVILVPGPHANARFGPQRPLVIYGGHSDAVFSASFTPDRSHIVTGSFDYTCRVIEGAGGATRQVYRAHTAEITRSVVSRCGRFAASGSWDGTARVWRVDTGAEVAVMRHPEGAKIMAVDLSPDGAYLATAASDRAVRVWHAHDGRLVTELGGHRATSLSVHFSPDGLRLASSSLDRTVRVHELWEDADARDALAAMRARGEAPPLPARALDLVAAYL